MIMGYEAPVEITPTSVYDKDMMKMYLAAMQRDYEQGLQDEKDYLKSVLDFTSPITADAETWANMTTKPMALLLQDPNIIRSQEGRAMIALFIASRPYGDMAKLRQSATAAQEYVKNRDELKRQGLYSQAMDQWENPTGLDLWNTLQNGTWTTTSPSMFKTYDLMLKPIVDQLNESPHFLKNKDKYTLIFGISDDRIKDSINANYQDLMALPSMQYLASTVGNDPEKFKQVLFDRIRSKMVETEKVDEGRLHADEMAIKQKELSIKLAQAAAEIQGLGGKDGTYSYKATTLENGLSTQGFYDPNGQYSSQQVHFKQLNDYINWKRNNQIIYSPRLKKNVKFSLLTESEKKEILSHQKLRDNERVWVNLFNRNHQGNVMANWYRNRKGYAANASEALAFTDDSTQWLTAWPETSIYKKDSNTIGVVLTQAERNMNLSNINELTAKTGAFKKVNNTRTQSGQDIRHKVSYITPVNGQKSYIIQYEPSEGKYIGYKKVECHDKDDNYIGDMWYNMGDAADMQTTLSNGIDSRSMHALNISVDKLKTPVNTVN